MKGYTSRLIGMAVQTYLKNEDYLYYKEFQQKKEEWFVLYGMPAIAAGLIAYYLKKWANKKCENQECKL